MNKVQGIQVNRSAKRRAKLLLSGVLAGTSLLVTTLHVGDALAQSNLNGAQSVSYGANDQYSDSITRKIYGGIGFGASWLEPDTSEVDGVDPNKRVNGAGQLTLGMDINKWVSIEGHAAALGEAGLSPSGELSYQTMGISALAYAGKSRHRYNRRGLSGFGRVGYGFLRNEPSDGLEFEQVNASHLLLGMGLEFATRSGLAVRAEGILFDADVRYGQLSLLYRLGKRRDRQPERIVEAPAIQPLSEPTPAPVITPIPAIAVAPIDTDTDGVIDMSDQCPNTKAGIAVDDIGCALFDGVIEGVNFNSGSAELTPNAQGILSGVVATLSRYPNVKLAIMAHTDSQGADDANKNLSRQRARSVAVYLVQRGIGVQRLQAFGYGEERPIDTNETADGRKRNRRVEFRAAN